MARAKDKLFIAVGGHIGAIAAFARAHTTKMPALGKHNERARLPRALASR